MLTLAPVGDPGPRAPVTAAAVPAVSAPEALVRRAFRTENASERPGFESRAFLTRALFDLCESRRSPEINDRFAWALLWGSDSGEDLGRVTLVSLAPIPGASPGTTRIRAVFTGETDPHRRTVDYDVAQEAGRARVADIHYHAKGLPASLRAYLASPPKASRR